MYKCICKYCGYRVNRLFVVPERVRERWCFGCPQCGRRTALPDFSALTAKALHAGRCLTPLFTSATRGLMRALRGVRRKKANRGHGAVAARSRYLKKKPV